MKKLFFSFAIVAAVVFSACNSKTEEAPAEEPAATEEVAAPAETPAAEAAPADSTAAATPAQ